ncbi:DNA adenine methylase [Salinibaculum rarum]|uniref:DNA adenine methylase n=1 Tax=Salinibaculum rarum TaxID=3058903 RepID=UPI00265FF79E|nr:DNA adenine methylase [Salinibaculum sp. KK48]
MTAVNTDTATSTTKSQDPPGNTQTVFPYPGGKGDHVDWILDHLPDHRCYVEPFAGSAAVLVNKEPSPSEVINDANGDVTTFFRVLRDQPDALIEWLHRVPYARSLYEDWATTWMDGERPNDDIEHAGRFYVLRQMQMMGKLNSVAGLKTGAKYPASRTFHNARQQLKQFAERFQEVTIENRDWHDILDNYDTENSIFYCDPPYVDQEDTYGIAFNQERFARAISNIDGKCLISYEDIPAVFDLDEFYVVEKDTARRMGSQQRDVTERLLLNFDPKTNETFTDAEQTTLGDLA